MLTFLAIVVGAVGLWILLGALRPLVERGVVTSEDFERVEDESLVLLDQRDRLVAELRELEFEAALDKIGRKDLEELRTRYELEAVALDRQLGDQVDRYSARIDADVEARLAGRAPEAPPEVPEVAEGPDESSALTELACGRCRAVNRPGARFCNDCGAPLTLAEAGALT